MFLCLYVVDVDAAVTRAIEAGGRELMPVDSDFRSAARTRQTYLGCRRFLGPLMVGERRRSLNASTITQVTTMTKPTTNTADKPYLSIDE